MTRWKSFVFALCVGGGLLAGTASAETTTGCAEALSGVGKPIHLPDVLSEPERIDLSHGVFQALRDTGDVRTWPAPQIDAAPACVLGAFEVGEHAYLLSGGKAPSPLRWARSATDDAVYFLAADGDPANTGPEGRRYYLAAMHPSTRARFIIQIYDGPPDDARVQRDIQASEEPESSPIAAYDPDGDAVSVFRLSSAGQGGQLFGPIPTPERPATLYLPDGRYFYAADGMIYMRSPAYPCPDVLGGMSLGELIVADGADATLDLACRYHGDDANLNLFVYKAQGAELGETFAVIRERLASEAPNTRSGPPLVRIGGPNRFPAGYNWTHDDGVGEGVWLAQRGDYFIQVRASWTPAAVKSTREALETLQAITYERSP